MKVDDVEASLSRAIISSKLLGGKNHPHVDHVRVGRQKHGEPALERCLEVLALVVSQHMVHSVFLDGHLDEIGGLPRMIVVEEVVARIVGNNRNDEQVLVELMAARRSISAKEELELPK